MSALLQSAARLWRSGLAPAGLREALAGPAGRAAVRMALTGAGARRHTPEPRRAPVLVSTLLNERSGIARAGRLTADALEAAGYQVIRHDVRELTDAAGVQTRTLPGDGGIWLLHCNPPEALAAMARVRADVLRDRYRIGYWAWELPKAPPAWLRASRLFHDVWAPSRFTADALRQGAAPVTAVPHPIPDLTAVQPDRERFGLPADRVVVLAMADLKSSADRKNPYAAVAAYLRAFPQDRGRSMLVVKLSSAEFDAAAWSRLQADAGGRADVRLMTDPLDDTATLTLLASADVVVSLHRAEGFGLVIAEAMAMGRPVVATDWSGNVDFTGGLSEGRVPYTLRPVADRAGLYPAPGQVWAEPDVDAAAAAILRLAADPALRSRLGEEGRAAVARTREPWWPDALERGPLGRYGARA